MKQTSLSYLELISHLEHPEFAKSWEWFRSFKSYMEQEPMHREEHVTCCYVITTYKILRVHD